MVAPKRRDPTLVSKMVLLNEVISTKIMIELVIFEILSFVERTKNTAGYRATLPALCYKRQL